MSKAAAKEPSGAERRRTRRRPVLDTFSIFVVVPKKGVHRLQLHDLSDHGIGFELDTEGESFADFPIHKDESLDLRLYLNQSLYLPLSIQVVRIVEREAVRYIGAEFAEKKSKNYKAFMSFLTMLDAVADVAQIEGEPLA